MDAEICVLACTGMAAQPRSPSLPHLCQPIRLTPPHHPAIPLPWPLHLNSLSRSRAPHAKAARASSLPTPSKHKSLSFGAVSRGGQATRVMQVGLNKTWRHMIRSLIGSLMIIQNIHICCAACVTWQTGQ